MTELSRELKQATPVHVARGEGVYVFDDDGRRYLDFTAGIGVTSTGHCHPRVVEAAQRQVATLIHGQYTTYLSRPLRDLTAKLGEVLPSRLDRLFFVNSGSEAVEAGMRLVRQATGRQNIVVFHGSFHGRTYGAASLTTSGYKFRAGIGPLPSGVAVSPFPFAFRYGWDVDTATDFALRELDYVLATTAPANDTAAFFVEPVLGEGGYVPANPRFLAGLRERADRHGILLVIDEIQTGFGRTGRFWGHDHFGVRPDVMLTAKGIASGFPLSVVAASDELMSKAWPGSQGGTYGANPVSCAAAIATIDVIRDEHLVENSAAMGERLADGLRKVAAEHDAIGDVRGLGLMVGSEFVDAQGMPDTATAVRAQRAAGENGLLLLTCGVHGNVVRMIPALVVDTEQVDTAVEIWGEAVASAVDGGADMSSG
ncbi:MAG: aspartate aminotransferase family protein [Streptosporangiales bacterium]|nr:aspartate aminotransferase family protein [Streptosporangiales bacterium]MBO0892124.1 aspartate aminotransferase family protein [Acidothermales bacterium]